MIHKEIEAAMLLRNKIEAENPEATPTDKVQLLQNAWNTTITYSEVPLNGHDLFYVSLKNPKFFIGFSFESVLGLSFFWSIWSGSVNFWVVVCS